MEHEAAGPLLDEFARGELADDEAREVAAHVAGCALCRGLLDTLDGLRAGIRLDQRLAGGHHPATEDLVAYAIGDAGLSEESRSELAAHLATCEDCEADAAAVSQADQSVRTPSSSLSRSAEGGSRGRSWSRVWAIAASVAILIMAYPTWRGVSTLLPHHPGEIPDTHGRAAVVELTPGTRGDEAPGEYHLDKDISSVVLAVEPVVPSEDLERDRLRFAVFDATANAIGEWSVSVEDARRSASEPPGRLYFPVKASGVPPGRYVLVELGPDGRERLRIEFVVIGAVGR